MAKRIYCLLLLLLPLPAAAQAPAELPFKQGDRIAWIGSSSTKIGVWPKTLEFLLRTRHPELKLSFARHTTGGGSFATGVQNLDKWLDESKPTVVLFNYGGNDANAGDKGLDGFKKSIDQCVAKVAATGARVLFTTHQASDERRSGAAPAAKRKLYAEELLAYGKRKGWTVYDVFHPLDALQRGGQQDDDKFTILTDTIHLTQPAYIAWGYFLYAAMQPTPVSSNLDLTENGKVNAAVSCVVKDVQVTPTGLTFVRHDAVLPILPPIALPPTKHVPLAKYSFYRLRVQGLRPGNYSILCEGKQLGIVEAVDLEKGVNLNELLLTSKQPAPWAAQARRWWDGQDLEQIGQTAWRFEVRRVSK